MMESLSTIETLSTSNELIDIEQTDAIPLKSEIIDHITEMKITDETDILEIVDKTINVEATLEKNESSKAPNEKDMDDNIAANRQTEAVKLRTALAITEKSENEVITTAGTGKTKARGYDIENV